ncbi:putative plastid-lipid-associated protein 14, chloroplastic [Dichanthelium oligosanthes]|uniref:Putative plastid-lipid-associated protein 14, chloroplastic n=1 Tax=Dichanthelium oligosanthes TaxID=888268 RepID=A0A1E5VTE4_9POAL|nr:putative plastid-lipid-associated protein 14, chloroplastic [Dichanthelium oligosanthes]
MPLAAAAACPSPVGLARPLCRVYAHPRRRRGFRLEATSSAPAPAPAAADEGAAAGPCLVVRFDMDDFAIADRVSVGLHGRSDETIFEATVRDPSSELYGSTVVLRQLKSSQAKRRGRRALEVLKKLARRQMMYHSYAMQVHGYIAPGNAVEQEDVPFVLVHGVNYLHSHGLAHTELRLENVHVSPIDKHVKVSSLSFCLCLFEQLKITLLIPHDFASTCAQYLCPECSKLQMVGILGNAADFHDNDPSSSTVASNRERRKMMIAFDMRCVGFIMAKMVLRELMDPSTFFKFKSFLTKGNDPSCLREFLLPLLCQNSPSGNIDRQWGAGWNLLALLLATKPEKRISCLDALRHPFLCGPKWRINPSTNIIRWGLGSTAVHMAEDYIYGRHQNWLHLLPGRWRLLYCTGRHIGLTLRQPSPRILISDVFLTVSSNSVDPVFSLTSDTGFRIMPESNWPHDKSGTEGVLSVTTSARIAAGRIYINEQDSKESRVTSSRYSRRYLRGKWRKLSKLKELPASLPSVNIAMDEVDISMSCNLTLNVNSAQKVLQEIRTQTPPEVFDLSKIVCGTYIDARLMVLRGVNGSALLFIRSNPATES